MGSVDPQLQFPVDLIPALGYGRITNLFCGPITMSRCDDAHRVLTSLREVSPIASPQGWHNRRKRVSWVLSSTCGALIIWTLGAAWSQAMGRVLEWPYVGVGLILGFMACYVLSIYIDGASKEHISFTAEIARLVEAFGNATGRILGNDPAA